MILSTPFLNGLIVWKTFGGSVTKYEGVLGGVLKRSAGKVDRLSGSLDDLISDLSPIDAKQSSTKKGKHGKIPLMNLNEEHKGRKDKTAHYPRGRQGGYEVS
jgi:hypothetical protein